MSFIAKTNELHGYLNALMRSSESEAYQPVVACLLLEQAIVSLLAEITGQAIVGARTLEQAMTELSAAASTNWLLERLCREYYQPGHWLNDLRLARQQLLQASPMSAPTDNLLISTSTIGSNPSNAWLDGFAALLVEVREFNTEY